MWDIWNLIFSTHLVTHLCASDSFSTMVLYKSSYLLTYLLNVLNMLIGIEKVCFQQLSERYTVLFTYVCPTLNNMLFFMTVFSVFCVFII